MRKKNTGLRVLAAIICASIVFTSNGLAVLAEAPVVSNAETEAETDANLDETDGTSQDEEVVGDTSESGDSQGDLDEDDQKQNDTDESDKETSDEADDNSDEELPADDEEEVIPEEELIEGEDVLTEEAEEPLDEELLADEDAELEELGATNQYFDETQTDLTLNGSYTKDSLRSASAITIPKSVTKIPANYFEGFDNLIYITIPDDSALTEIEQGAFSGTGIKTINIPAGVTKITESCFEGCTSLTTVNIRGSISEVEDYAFKDCNKLTGVNLTGTTEIGNEAFMGCTALSSVGISNIEVIGARAFYNCSALSRFAFPSSITEVGSYAFALSGLTVVNLADIQTAYEADGITEKAVFGIHVFDGCSKLATIEWPGTQEIIPDYTFNKCTLLSSVTIQPGVEEIASNAFSNCTSLKSISFPESTEKFDQEALAGCTAIANIYIYCPATSAGINIHADAFPARTSQVTMYGFHAKVKSYADGKTNYTFATLLETHTITPKVTNTVGGKMTLSTKSAAADTVIVVTLTPAEGYVIKQDALTYTDNGTIKYPEYVSVTGSDYKFRFVMPNNNTTVTATFAKASSAVSGKLSYTVAGEGVYFPYDAANKTYTFEKAGQSVEIKVTDEKMAPVAPWLMAYSSSDAAIVKISASGVITGVKKGTAKITAKLKSDTTKTFSFYVSVAKTPVIPKENFDISFSSLPTGVTTSSFTEKDGTVVPVITIPKSYVSKAAMGINVNISTKDEQNTPLVVTSYWSSVDAKVASVKASVLSDVGKITIPQKAEGEATVTISIKNTTTDPDLKVINKKVIVRVVDVTPRLAQSKITVAYDSDTGTDINIIPVYGYDIVPGSFCIKKMNSTGGYVNATNVICYTYDGSTRKGNVQALTALNLAAGKSVTYKGANKLYLSGLVEDTSGNQVEFYTPIPELVVTRVKLSPTIKTSGKINLFYNENGTAAEQGTFVVTHNLSKYTLSSARLVSTDAGNLLGQNFVASVDAAKNRVLINRTDTAIVKDANNKLVTKGYLYLTYVGYAEVRVPITIATCNTAPTLVFNKQSATVNTRIVDQEFTLKILDKNTKKEIDLSRLDTLDTKLDGKGYVFDDLNTTGKFKKGDFAADTGTNTVLLTVDGSSRNAKGKAVINIKLDSWAKPAKVTFTLNSTGTLAKGVLSSKNITLNSLVKSQSGSINLTLNQKEATLTGFDDPSLVFAGNKKLRAEAAKLIDDIDLSTPGKIVASLDPGESVAPGTYEFKVRPLATYDGGTDISLDYVNFKIIVNGASPVLTLASPTLTLNAYCPGTEVVYSKYTLANMPAGVSYEIDDSSLALTATKGGTAANEMKNYLTLVVNPSTKKLSLNMSSSAPCYTNFNYTYKVSGLKVKFDDGHGGYEYATIKPFALGVKGNYAKPSVTIKASGKLNTIDPNSCIKYTVTPKNITGGILDVAIWEYDVTNNLNQWYVDEHGDPYSPHFTATLTNSKTVAVKANAILNAKVTYKYVLAFELASDPGNWITTNAKKPFTLKPAQTFPKLKSKKSDYTLYAGQDATYRYVNLKFEQTSLKNATISDIVIDTKDEAIKAAYDVRFTGGKWRLYLVDPSKLVAGKKYKLKLVTVYDEQLKNTKGPSITINASIVK